MVLGLAILKIFQLKILLTQDISLGKMALIQLNVIKVFVIVRTKSPVVYILYLVVCQALYFRHGIITGEPQKCFRFFGKPKGGKKLKRSKKGGGRGGRKRERIEGLLSILFLETGPMGITQQGCIFIKHNKRPLCSHVCAEQMSGGVLGRIT